MAAVTLGGVVRARNPVMYMELPVCVPDEGTPLSLSTEDMDLFTGIPIISSYVNGAIIVDSTLLTGSMQPLLRCGPDDAQHIGSPVGACRLALSLEP